MSIQDINFLKDNSKISTHKYHFQTPTNESGVFNFPNDEILNNVFTLHILSAKCDSTDTVLEISGNNIKMDSMQLFATTDIVYNTTGLVYEKVVHPLAKLSSITYNFSVQPTSICYITFIARNYEPNTNFNQNMYNDLNPAYNPHIIPESSGTDEDTDESD